MGALANAAKLLKDSDFRDWMTAAGAYQARQVILEDPATADHSIRLLLANDAIVTPEITTDRLVTIIGTDPTIAADGSTVATLNEGKVLTAVANSWTTIAKMMYPPNP